MKSTDALTAVAVVALATLPGLAMAQATSSDAALIEEGRRLFFEETFGGNGRTCGSCHPAENNFTIDPEFISRLPRTDPLFVAAPSRGNALTPLEIDVFLRRGLICENTDGSFERDCVLRGVPHTLALRTSLTPRADFPLDEATGWSGDGAPGDGTLRSFAIGAIRQHFTRRIGRVEGRDFRLPTERELDALEAFQLSLGRQEDLNVTPGAEGELVFADELVEEGKALFHEAPSQQGTRGCAFCHSNAGASTPDGENRNFDTGVARLPNGPACSLGFNAAGDGGFGAEPTLSTARAALCANAPLIGPRAGLTFHGDGTFNTPPLVEAADTPPHFHNDAARTLEEAIGFYATTVFSNSPAGGGDGFLLTDDDIVAIGAFLRALNIFENLRSAEAYLNEALSDLDVGTEEARLVAIERFELAVAEIDDAREVIDGGPVELFPATPAHGTLDLAREQAGLGLDGPEAAGALTEALLLATLDRVQRARRQIVAAGG